MQVHYFYEYGDSNNMTSRPGNEANTTLKNWSQERPGNEAGARKGLGMRLIQQWMCTQLYRVSVASLLGYIISMKTWVTSKLILCPILRCAFTIGFVLLLKRNCQTCVTESIFMNHLCKCWDEHLHKVRSSLICANPELKNTLTKRRISRPKYIWSMNSQTILNLWGVQSHTWHID